MAANGPMLGVFEHAGFAVRREGFGAVTVSLNITPTEAVLERIGERDHIAAIESMRHVLAPSSIAVAGHTTGSNPMLWGVLMAMLLERLVAPRVGQRSVHTTGE